MSKKKIGRDAGTGKFKSVKDAQKDKKGSVVENIKTPHKKSPPNKSGINEIQDIKTTTSTGPRRNKS